MPDKMAPFNAFQFMHVLSNQFLCILDEVKKDGGNNTMIIGASYYTSFNSAIGDNGVQKDCANNQIINAIAALNKRQKKGSKFEDMDEQEE